MYTNNKQNYACLHYDDDDDDADQVYDCLASMSQTNFQFANKH